MHQYFIGSKRADGGQADSIHEPARNPIWGILSTHLRDPDGG
jgi:hypothetical protein